MTSLREIQRGFAAAIRDPAAAARFAPRVNAGGLAPTRRLQLYRNNHYENLSEALAAEYPVVVRLVGEPYFRQTARAYVASHPSRRGDIHCYGDGFGDFLDGLPQAADYPYLGDVARLEWAYHSVFHTERRPPVDPRTLLTLDQGDYPQVRLEVQPAARLFASGFSVLLAVGLAGRFSAAALTVLNIVAVISFPALEQAGLIQHQLWGLLLLVPLLHGPGKLSLDRFITRRLGF